MKTRGFTLLEVLVALLVVALGMGAALSALSSAADNTTRLRDRTFAQWVGFNQVSTARLLLQLPPEGTTNGDIKDFANNSWSWEQEIKQIETPGIYRITVKVRRKDTTVGADTKAAWLATVTGFRGDALSAASGEEPDWNGVPVGAGGAPRQPTGGTTTTTPNVPGSPSAGSGTPPPVTTPPVTTPVITPPSGG